MTKPRFFRLALSLMLLLGAAGVSLGGDDTSAEEHRGGRVGWARLVTPDPEWALHSEQDPKLAAFIRSQTSLNIDPEWYTVRADKVDDLSVYPFIYVKDLSLLEDDAQKRNVAEYLRRGGFICVDPCVNGFSAAEKLALVRRHAQLFGQLLPGSVIRELPDDHEIYHCFFAVNVHELYTRDMIKRGAVKPPNIGLRGVSLDNRMIAVISITGLECGWPQTPQRTQGCMKLIVNSYIYSMTH